MRKFGIVLKSTDGKLFGTVVIAKSREALGTKFRTELVSIDDLGEMEDPTPTVKRSRLVEWYRALVSSDH